jgi:hypothetical protein
MLPWATGHSGAPAERSRLPQPTVVEEQLLRTGLSPGAQGRGLCRDVIHPPRAGVGWGWEWSSRVSF